VDWETKKSLKRKNIFSKSRKVFPVAMSQFLAKGCACKEIDFCPTSVSWGLLDAEKSYLWPQKSW